MTNEVWTEGNEIKHEQWSMEWRKWDETLKHEQWSR